MNIGIVQIRGVLLNFFLGENNLFYISQTLHRISKTTPGHHKKKTNNTLMSVSFYHVMNMFQNESTDYTYLNVKELLAQNRHELRGCNKT